MSKPTDVTAFMDSLGGGVTNQILAKVLTDTAQAVLIHGSKRNGKISLELTVDRMSEDSETGVKINAKLTYKMPTGKGSKMEDETRESVFFVDPQRGLVDTPPKAKDHDLGFQSGMPATHGLRGS